MEPKNLKNITQDIGSIDLKSYLLKIISYWKLFLFSSIIALAFAKYKNMMNTSNYKIDTQITIKKNSGSALSSSTNISFNWGGASDIVESVKAQFKSRTHNEKVVSELQFYTNYLEKEKILFKYRFNDIYGYTPFKINVENAYQIQGKKIELVFLEDNKVQLTLRLAPEEKSCNSYNYNNHTSKKINLTESGYQQIFNISQKILTPFCDFSINILNRPILNKIYYISFSSFNQTVAKYRGIRITSLAKGTSLLNISLAGRNKKRLIEYLNKTVEILGIEEKNEKIRYAINTKKFIDSLFSIEEITLNKTESQLVKFKTSNSVKLSGKSKTAYQDILILESENKLLQENTDLLLRLKNNTLTNDLDIKNIPLFEIKNPGLQTSLTELINYLILKEKLLSNSVYPTHPEFIELENKINLSKAAIKSKIEALIVYNSEKSKRIARNKSDISRSVKDLPLKEYQLLQLEKSYALSENNYNLLKQKSYDAGAAIAANSSSIKTIDNAKDIGQGPLATKKSFNYLSAILLAIILPLIFITIIEVLDDNIYTVDQIEKIYSIPVLGIIGKNKKESNLVLLNDPKSSTAESYRAIRSNIPYLFNKDIANQKNKTILCTSSVGGEGKTVTSMNIASSYALSGKKTILLGFDLRKPKIHKDFTLSSNDGIVEYLIGKNTLTEVIQKTKVPNLDIMLTGTIPPNPSELILGDSTRDMISKLKEMYDYVIIDTPPIGLVSDGLDLMKYSDANIYVTRQAYTKKGMMRMVDQKYVNDEIKNIAFVLNDFVQSSKHGYRYGYGYGYGYGSYGYHSDDEIPLSTKIKNLFNKNKTS